jgi:putative endonuclease
MEPGYRRFIRDFSVLAGLGPAIHAAPERRVEPRLAVGIVAATLRRMRGGWVYIMTNRPNGTLYVGVTADIARRAYEHREGLVEGFTRRYGLKRLVWMEFHDDIRAAIQREHNIKHWARAWKVRLIHDANRE